jgi:hypothetical protein
LQNQRSYADVSLGFNPQIVIATVKGKQVDAVTLAHSIHKKNGSPKIIGLRSSSQILDPLMLANSGIDECLDTPVNPKKLLQTIAMMGAIDEATLLEKYTKIKGFDNSPDAFQQTFTMDENGQPVDDIKKMKLTLQELSAAIHVSGGDGKSTGGVDVKSTAGLDSKMASASGVENPSGGVNSSVAANPGGDGNPSGSVNSNTKFPIKNENPDNFITGSASAEKSSVGVNGLVSDGSDNSSSSVTGKLGAGDLNSNVSSDGGEISNSIAVKEYLIPEDPERKKRFAEWEKKIGTLPKKSFDRTRIREASKKIRAWPVVEDINEIEDERKKFVKAMFKK